MIYPNIALVKQQSAKGTKEIQGTWKHTDDLNINIEWILFVISMKMIIATVCS